MNLLLVLLEIHIPGSFVTRSVTRLVLVLLENAQMAPKRSDPRTRGCIELTCFHRMSEEVTTMLEFSQSPERPRLSEILRKCCILGFLVAVRARSLTQLMAVRVVWIAFCLFL